MKQFVPFLGTFFVCQGCSTTPNLIDLRFVSDICVAVSINDNFLQIVYFSKTWAFYN